METIISFLDKVFGIETEEITTLQLLARAFVIYIIGIFLVRLGDKRFVGKMTAFDIIIAIVIGSLLSRAITNTNLFLKVLPACLMLILMHRLFSYIASFSDKFGNLIKGNERVIVEDGEILWKAMKKSHLSEQDLMQTLRLNTNSANLKKTKIARLERNGDISFIFKNDQD